MDKPNANLDDFGYGLCRHVLFVGDKMFFFSFIFTIIGIIATLFGTLFLFFKCADKIETYYEEKKLRQNTLENDVANISRHVEKMRGDLSLVYGDTGLILTHVRRIPQVEEKENEQG